MTKTVTLYRLEDKQGLGPGQSPINKPDGFQANPRLMDTAIRWQQGDDLWKYKYACTSMKYLEIYMGKKYMQTLQDLGFKIAIKEVLEHKVRYAGTRKVVAYKFTNQDQFPSRHYIKDNELTYIDVLKIRALKNAALVEYYEKDYHNDYDYRGQFGFMKFFQEFHQKIVNKT